MNNELKQQGLEAAYATYDKYLLPSEQMEAAIKAYLPYHISQAGKMVEALQKSYDFLSQLHACNELTPTLMKELPNITVTAHCALKPTKSY